VGRNHNQQTRNVQALSETPAMSKDILKVASLPGVEPEEQPVTREVDLPITARGNLTGESLGTLAGAAEITETAGTFAQSLRKICSNCKHFDRAAAQRLFAKQALTPEGKKELINLGVNILQMDPGADLEASMRELGRCAAFSEARAPDDVIVHPLGHCPSDHYGFGDLFKPIDRAAEARGDKGYDLIMQQAAGKVIL
jgi:hypothetical protein